MRLAALFKKTMTENLRDWKILILTLTFSPFFVMLMHFYLGSAAKTFKVAVINHDRGATDRSGAHFEAGQALVSEMKKVKNPDGTDILEVSSESTMSTARARLADKAVDLVVEIPDNFSKILVDYKEGRTPPPAIIKTYGDPANAKYILAAASSDFLAYQYGAAITGQKGPLDIQAETIEEGKSLNDFELYVPSLLGLALMMLMFTAAASIIKEKDKGTLVRLQMSKMRVYEFLSAISLSQILIGLLALGLTLLTAWGFGYRTNGSLVAVMAVGLLSSLAVIAISLLVAAFLRTIFDLLTIGCFPFFILMFFSGGMIPLPPLKLLTVGGRPLNINDILPTTHTISALGKVLNFGAGLGDLKFEIAAIAVLTALYFAAGMWLFNRRHLEAQ